MKKTTVILMATLNLFSISSLAAETTYTRKILPGAPQPVDQKATLLNDAEIIAVVRAINQYQLKSSDLAEDKAQQSGVELTAQEIKKDHENLDLAIENIVKKTKISPKETELSRNIQKEAERKLAELSALKETNFDAKYLHHTVDFTAKIMNRYATDLIPNAKNAELKAELQDGLAVIRTEYQKAGAVLNGLMQNEPAKKTE